MPTMGGVHCGDAWGTTLPGRQLLPPGRLQQLYLSGVCADPRCSISRAPRREECTICTTVAPDDAFTVRRYGDTRHDTASASAQPRHPPATNPQVSGSAPRSTQESGRSQVISAPHSRVPDPPFGAADRRGVRRSAVKPAFLYS
jgi:hypothetical protein